MESSADALPERIGRYFVVRELGRGGMGTVYQAYDDTLERAVAIKVLPIRSSDAVARFRREAEMLARLQHPGIVRVFEVGFTKAASFIVMELVHGETLRDWLQTPRTPTVIRDVFVQIAEALVAAHEAGIVHRDIKPDNVVLSNDGRVRVLDFGLAMLERAEASPTPQSGISGDERITRTGSLVGTPAYMSPEQHLGGTVDHRTDQFSFCVALYEALYGRRPFSGKSLDDVRKATIRGHVDPPRVRGVAARAIRRVVRRGLASIPEERWPSMQAVATQLRAVAPRRGLRFAALGVGAALVLAAAMPVGGDECDAEALMRDSIGGERLARADAAIREVGTPYAAAAADTLAEGIGAHAVAWTSAYQAYCEAAPSEEHDEVGRCLHNDLGWVEARLDAMARTDAQSVFAVVPAIRNLKDPQRCIDPDKRDPPYPVPRDPAVAANVATVREGLRTSAALMETGQYEAAEVAAVAALRQAEAAAFEPATAEAEHAVAVAVATLGRTDEARPHFEAAYFKASAAGHGRLAVSAAHSMARLEGRATGDLAAAQHWIDAAAAWIDRLPDETKWRVQHSLHEADLYQARDQPERAAALVEPLLTELEGIDDPELPRAARATLAIAFAESGQFDKAVEHQRVAVELTRAAYGGPHPDLAANLANLGRMLLGAGKADEALTFVEKGIDLYIETAGPDYPMLGNAYGMKSDILLAKGDHAGAAQAARQAIAVQEPVLGPDHPAVQTNHARLAQATAARD